jgi:hypothetical protein
MLALRRLVASTLSDRRADTVEHKPPGAVGLLVERKGPFAPCSQHTGSFSKTP